MCIIEVKAGMRHVTVAQAMAHNTSTIERDMDFLRKYISAHPGAPDAVDQLALVERASMHLHAAYKALLDHWHIAMCAELDCGDWRTADPQAPIERKHWPQAWTDTNPPGTDAGAQV